MKTLCLILVGLGISSALAQQGQIPRVGYVYPAGGRQGTTFQVKLGGQFLDGVTNAIVSGNGISTRIINHTKPITQQQFNAARDKLKELRDRRQAAMRNRGAIGSTNVTWTAADDKLLIELANKIATFQRRPANPAIVETVTLQVTISANAEPGQREVRLRTPGGLSNPLVLFVGQLPEYCKREPQGADAKTPLRARRNPGGERAAIPTDTSITLPAVVNGQVLPGGVDRYHFQARQGQSLVITTCARQLMPYLADAVPGWFQATLTLYDAKGKEVAYDDDFRFHPDPVLHYVIPASGEYVAEIKDAIYRGREDFVYRISICEAPFITGIFPLGGRAGTESQVELTGWNLSDNVLKQDNRTNEPGIHFISVRKGDWISNRAPYAVDTLPECLDIEPNDSPPQGQAVQLPVIINGRIDKPGDADVFTFRGHAGDQVSAEVCARHLDSSLDSLLRLSDASGKQIALNDDFEDKASGLNTHHADSRILVALPADGTYSLQLTDAQRHGGPEYAYRLRISQPRPDFAVRIVPSSINIRAGASAPLTAYLMRKDGFTNEVTLALDEAPNGYSLSGGRIPAGQDQIRFTLQAPPEPRTAPAAVTIQASAVVMGERIVRAAVAADDMEQAFAYHHLVPADSLLVSVSGRSALRNAVELLDSAPVRIPVGGTARVRLGAPTRALNDRFELALDQEPDGITLKRVTPLALGAEIVFECDAAKVKRGQKGNLIISILPGRTATAAASKTRPAANLRRISQAVLPAIPFEIVGP